MLLQGVDVYFVLDGCCCRARLLSMPLRNDSFFHWSLFYCCPLRDYFSLFHFEQLLLLMLHQVCISTAHVVWLLTVGSLYYFQLFLLLLLLCLKHDSLLLLLFSGRSILLSYSMY
jgi:hypothetical protein